MFLKMPKGYIAQPGSGSSNRPTNENIQYVDITVTYRIPLAKSLSNKSRITCDGNTGIKAEFAAQLLISLGLFPSHFQPKIIKTSLVDKSTGTNNNIIESEKPPSNSKNKIITGTDGGYSDVNAGLTTSSSSTQPRIIETSLIHSDTPNCANPDIQEQQQSPANRNQISAVTDSSNASSDTSLKISQIRSSTQVCIIKAPLMPYKAPTKIYSTAQVQKSPSDSQNLIVRYIGNGDMKTVRRHLPTKTKFIGTNGVIALSPNNSSSTLTVKHQSDRSVQPKQAHPAKNKISSSTQLKKGAQLVPKRSQTRNNPVRPSALITVDQASLPKPVEVVNKPASLEIVNEERKHSEDRGNPARIRHAVSTLASPCTLIACQKHKITGSEQMYTHINKTMKGACVPKHHPARDAATSTTSSSPKLSPTPSPVVITARTVLTNSPLTHSSPATMRRVTIGSNSNPTPVHNATSPGIKESSTQQSPVQITPCSIQLTRLPSSVTESASAEITSSKGPASQSLLPTTDIEVPKLTPSKSLSLSPLWENLGQENSVHDEADIETAKWEIVNIVKLEAPDECSRQTKPSGSCNHSTHRQTSTRVTTSNCVSCVNHREKPPRVKIPKHKKPFKCDHCPARYILKAFLKKHLLQKHKGVETVYRCEKCNFKTINEKGLPIHDQRKHPNGKKLQRCNESRSSKKPFVCNYCDKRFILPLSLEEHIMGHTGERPYKCELCVKGFKGAQYLEAHMRHHTGERPYKCERCEKMFISSHTLKIHMQAHTANPHKCRICGKEIRVRYLKRHMLTHSGEKPHSCGVCEKGFPTLTTLRRHMLTHTGHNPHKCELCGEEFMLPWKLKKHMWIHTGQGAHKCGICEKSYSNSSNLKDHIMTHAPGYVAQEGAGFSGGAYTGSS